MTEEELSLEDQLAELKEEVKRNEEAFQALAAETDRLKARNRELETWHIQNSTKIKESEEWRKKFELSVHTPEYKQDAESAYDRGHYAARQKMAAWFIQTGHDMQNEETPTDKEHDESVM